MLVTSDFPGVGFQRLAGVEFGPDQRHDHRPDREFSFLGPRRQIPQVSARTLDLVALLVDRGQRNRGLPLPRRGLNSVEASVYIGVSTTTFANMVKDHTMRQSIDSKAQIDGSGGGTRTPDPRIMIPVL